MSHHTVPCHTLCILSPQVQLQLQLQTRSLLSANQFAAWADRQPKSDTGLSAAAYVAIAHVVCWLAQFYGHAAHEKRKPALMDNLFQAFLAAPLFVLLTLVSPGNVCAVCCMLLCASDTYVVSLEHLLAACCTGILVVYSFKHKLRQGISSTFVATFGSGSG
eukprot:TRINITY_DN399_c0_g1_i2.p2 TRINITY_DN399_c0_g1~~TRINITY_DN399_c0_g1_i2.p2  ORF type:complete len:162 (+),score=23.10 TRINITY_DN399_c0_g1_i2:121-606(+)